MSTDSDFAITGILLAAGRGRRFGAEGKSLHPLPDGRALAETAAINLSQVLPVTLAVIRTGDIKLRRCFEHLGIHVLPCHNADAGMGASLAFALSHLGAHSDGFIVALADMPFIRCTTIAAVAQALRAGAEIAAPSYAGRIGHPVGFARKYKSELMSLSGDCGARMIVAKHQRKSFIFNCNDRGILIDVDTPLDLSVALRLRETVAAGVPMRADVSRL